MYWPEHQHKATEEGKGKLDLILRIRYKNDVAKHYEFSDDYETLYVKETAPGEDKFGNFQKAAIEQERKSIMLCSFRSWYWFFKNWRITLK